MSSGASAYSGGLPAEHASFDPWVGLGLGMLFVALNGFFVAAEFALVKVRSTQIEPHAARGELRGKTSMHLIGNMDAYLSACQLGITLSSLALGWIGEPAFAWILAPVLEKIPGISPAATQTVGITVAFTLITVLHIVLGEQAPKTFAIRRPEATTLLLSLPLYAFFKITYPLIWLLNHASNALLRLVGVAPVSEAELAHSEEEMRLMLSSEHAGELHKDTRKLLDNIFELTHRVARHIMVPRADVIYLSLTQSVEDNIEIARESAFTRFPLCKGDLDEVVGLLHIKDLFYKQDELKSLEDINRDLEFVPETLPLDKLLRRMRQERLHMAAVVDEYGGVSGIVTLEDVIEEIVGQIQDEFDEEHPDVVAMEPGVWRVAGSILVMDLEQAIGLELSDRDEDTVGGLVLSELGRSPRIGDSVQVGIAQFSVLEANRRRIHLLEVRVTPAEEGDDKS
ncbi:MAG TPA: hemolysin family protein [Polyangiaceae bacterium]|nr:hemolysin family protein [Polyangiaceae bacterium]